MTDQQQPEQMIANEAVFLQTLGINPGTVRKGSVNVEFMDGQPVITFGSIYPVSPRALGLAFLASGAEEQQEEQTETKPQRRQPADRKPPAKRAPAKKTAPRKKVQP